VVPDCTLAEVLVYAEGPPAGVDPLHRRRRVSAALNRVRADCGSKSDELPSSIGAIQFF
jgi:hypothetical protein